MASRRDVDIADILARGTPIDEAMNKAVRDAVRLHKRMGLPMAAWQDGKVVWIPPEQLPLEGEELGRGGSPGGAGS
jgi:hypothetical protein